MAIPDIRSNYDRTITHPNGAVSYVGMYFEEPEAANVSITGEEYQEMHIVLDETMGVSVTLSTDAIAPIVEAADDAVGEYMEDVGMPEFSGVVVTGNVLGKNVTTVVELEGGDTIIEALETVLTSHISAATEVLKTQTPKRH